MGWKWTLNNFTLFLSDANNEYYPSAEEIFSSVKGHPLENLPCDHPPKDDLPNIRYSSIGADLIIRLNFKNQKIILSCEVEKRGSVITFFGPVEKIPDNAVVKDTWVYFTTSYEEILEIFQKAKINILGEISLIQYIVLAKELVEHPSITVFDGAREFLDDHPLDGEINENPEGLFANLYLYQKKGYQWLRFMSNAGCGCILADEMGLGKTLQVIALIVSRLNEVDSPALVIAPVSLLENWRREFLKFTEGVRLLIHHGPERTGFYKDFLKCDVVITSYGTVVSDLSVLQMVNWNLLVLDEAQSVKNPDAKRTKSVKALNREISLAVTGTPFENHMSDLWSLIDFILPGSMGTLSEFSSYYPDDILGASKLEPLLKPLMLRRRVSDVANDLPERVDVPQALEMTRCEAAMYDQERLKIIALYGMNASLPLLQKLRVYCTHPALEDEYLPYDPCINSTKYQRLCQILEEVFLIEEKIILFTSFNGMFSILQNDIPRRFGVPVFKINGSTPVAERQSIIDMFSDISGSALLVLNPKAAGLGLNITAASRVIHYNLEWNPSLEDQASARAYRRGQEKTVFIYRLFYKDTVEEVINERIERKREMSDTVVTGTTGEDATSEDIVRALTMSPQYGIE